MSGVMFGGQLTPEARETVTTARGLTRDATPVLMTLARGVFAFLDHLDRKTEEIAAALYDLIHDVEKFPRGPGDEWPEMTWAQKRVRIARRAAAIIDARGGAFVGSPACHLIVVHCGNTSVDPDKLLPHLHAVEDATALFAIGQRLQFGQNDTYVPARDTLKATELALAELPL